MTPERWERIRSLLHAALAVPPGEREAFLHRECRGDVELECEIRAMLEEHERAGMLDGSPLSPAASPVFEDGSIVAGRYRILRFVSRGGMGEVYEAEDLDLNERVALKTLLPSIAADSRMITRFKREIQLSRKIGHPNVCRMFDLARHPADTSAPDCTYFLTMEFLQGETLAEALHRDSFFSTEAALPLLDQIAVALDAAHRAEVIHRDLKPSNVILVPENNGARRAVVGDFGLARSFTRGEVTGTRSTQLIGTLEYMAPELLGGHPASIASDIYALGMLACKMLAGILPAPDSPVKLSPVQERAILRAIDPRPTARFSSAAAFVQALRGESAGPAKVSVSVPRRRVIAAAAALAIVAATPFVWRRWTRTRTSPKALALYQRGVSGIQAGTYFAATKTLGEAIEQAPSFGPAHARLAEAWNELQMPERASREMLLARRQDLTALSAADRFQLDAIDLTITREFPSAVAKYEAMRTMAPPGIDVDLGRAYEKAARGKDATASYLRATQNDPQNPAAWLRLAMRYSRAADVANAAGAFANAEKIYRLDNNLEGLIEVALQRGVDANRRTKYDEAAEQLRRALDTAHLAANVQQAVAATLQLATNAFLAGDLSLSERYAQGAISEAQTHQMEPLAIAGLVNLGTVHFRRRDLGNAEKYDAQALAMARSTGTGHLAAIALISLASVHDQMSQTEKVLKEAAEALEFYRTGNFTGETLICYTLLGRAHKAKGNFAAAHDAYQSVLSLSEKANDRSGIAQAHSSLGSLLASQERFPEALPHYQSYAELATTPEDQGYAALQCGGILWRLGRYDEAGGRLSRASEFAGKFPDLRFKTAWARAEMALSQNRYRDAISDIRAILPTISPQDDSLAIECHRTLGLAFLRSGRLYEGRAQCEAALESAKKLANSSLLLTSRLAILEAHVASRDVALSRAVLKEMQSTLEDQPESRWRAYALFGKLDPLYNTAARQALDGVIRLWGAPATLYLARPDIQELSRPLLTADSAMH